MASRFRGRPRTVGFALVWLAAALGSASAGPITTFLDRPTGLSTHDTNGSVIYADDFVPAYTGWTHAVFWWGSRAPSDSQWVIALYANSAGHPGGANPVADTLYKVQTPFVYGDRETGFGLGPDAQIWRYGIGLPEVVELIAGVDYWFSVTNLAPGWTWAEARSAPVVGTERFDAQSTDRTEVPSPDCLAASDPSLCYGPWLDTQARFAFQIIVPEPGSALLSGLALVLLSASRLASGRHSGRVTEASPAPV